MNLERFVEVHNAIGFLRRQVISDYWDELKEDDVIAHLSPRQRNFLATIQRFEPCSLHTVMNHTGLSSSAVSAAVDKMVRLGIVDRVRNDENRREVLVNLSDRIKEHFENIDRLFRQQIRDVLDDCSAEETSAILDGANVLLRKLNAKGIG